MKKYLLLLICSCKLSFANADLSYEEISFANNIMLLNNYQVADYDDVWERMVSGFQLQYYDSSRVRYYERFYSKNPARLSDTFNKASLYIFFILNQIERYGLPTELALIPIVESNYDPEAINGTGRYDGIWQFTLLTGQRFSLYENNEINDRKNIIKSTNAAVNYFIYLQSLFKQWEVAIGAYNWGEGAMYRAILDSHQTIGAVNYERLPLRQITADYVPKLIALSHIVKNPNKFGISLKYVANEPQFKITTPIVEDKVKNVANNAQISINQFKLLNPQFKNRNSLITYSNFIVLPNANYNFYVSYLDKYYNKSNSYYDDNEQKQILLATINENNKLIADNIQDEQNDSISTLELSKDDGIADIITNVDNHVNSFNDQSYTDKIITKKATANETRIIKPNYNFNSKLLVKPENKKYHIIKKGETLYSISKRYSIDLAKIVTINKIRNYDIKLGQRIRLY